MLRILWPTKNFGLTVISASPRELTVIRLCLRRGLDYDFEKS